MSKNWKLSVLVLVLCCAVLMSGCYGTFSLTKGLHHWNGTQVNRWAQEGVFLLLVIVPVYGVTLLGDALIFNAIEFWGGSNPIASTAMGEADAELDQVAALVGLPANLQVLGAAPGVPATR
ncbi:MAG: DUF3332 family protein [Planctomycetota bacterium]|jgi:hypothetical protein